MLEKYQASVAQYERAKDSLFEYCFMVAVSCLAAASGISVLLAPLNAHHILH